MPISYIHLDHGFWAMKLAPFVQDNTISMLNKSDFSLFAAWNLAFYCIPLAAIDPEFARRELDRLTQESYVHPNSHE